MAKDVRDCEQCFPPAVVRAGKASDTSTSFGSVLYASNISLGSDTQQQDAASRRLPRAGQLRR